MVRKKLLAGILAALFTLGCVAACGAEDRGGSWLDMVVNEVNAAGAAVSGDGESGGSWLDMVTQTVNGASQVAGSLQPGGNSPGNGSWLDIVAQAESAASALSLTVTQATGALTVERPELEEYQPMGAPGTWTIFVYLCGTDLESDDFGGMA